MKTGRIFDRTCSFTGLSAAVGAIALLGFAGAGADNLPPPATPADKVWLLGEPPAPADNLTTPARVELGKALFFDPRLSGNGTVSCASCHNPSLGWSDGLKTGIGINGTVLGRATPTVVNTAYNTQFMWDGRKKSLEDQALGPMKTPEEMKTDFSAALQLLNDRAGYRAMFHAAYPGEAISEETVAKAIAAFERTVVSKDSRFDRWVAGDRTAITAAEHRGYQVFSDPAKGNCAACHKPPNFTDNGFHNIGIAHAPGQDDEGRFKIRGVAVLKGAFKTPTLRDVELTAPYFHTGTATTLMDTVEHYARGGDDRRNLSPEVRKLNLSAAEKADLVAFMKTLTSPVKSASVPALPQ
ncbi:c-type cytochrome [Aquincola sp. S2]|uniref:C-type cytochrome n=1 Tax=Pseudaquabacterium terrae TaxID=2732868 RepID=A0ABX2EQ60_9BURK|nr:cytochrome c peroxidase [Aquabacterium terrae]NRF70675.1 c-type cytochrome [Aquabacterium terrae]